MAIKPIENLPGTQVDKYEAARDGLIEDVIQIIREKIPLCEITSEAYTVNTMRSAISAAIRRGTVRWNQSLPEGAPRIWPDRFTILRRKDAEKKPHFYIQYDVPEEEQDNE